MGDLIRSMLLFGVVSGTQPLTIMGLLVVMAGANPRRNGWCYVAGAFVVETSILILASTVFGGSIEPRSFPADFILGVELQVGVVLLLFGLRFRRPPRKPAPETPAALEKLKDLSGPKAFVGGLLLADYQGPVLGSMKLASTTATSAQRLIAVG